MTRSALERTPQFGRPKPRSGTVSRRAGADDPISLLARPLVAALASAWESGQPRSAVDLLAERPDLAGNADVAVRVIYEEICLRQEAGEEHPSVAVLQRFPQYRDQLELLLDCHRFLGPEDVPAFPNPGELLGEFQLLRELGKGARGRVYLAAQPALADRPVVLKVTPQEGEEHISLARLQHAHIVPLYFVQDFPERRLQGLCMPYLGGMSLSDLLRALKPAAPHQRSGARIAEVLAGTHAVSGGSAGRQPVQKFLERSSYTQAVCWIGACLADALHYAHDRGLIHLDVKPGNVLLAADGQPMLLDFHLAQPPIVPNQPPPAWVGGSPGYMAPEHEGCLRAVREGVPVDALVDGRADIYGLGMVLYECLGGAVPPAGRPSRLTRKNHPGITTGLADIVARCLETRPQERYSTAAAVATDLRQHLADLPLRGVRNRNPLERWQKWRRRRPAALTYAALFLLVAGALAVTAFGMRAQAQDQEREARALLVEGRRQHEAQQPAEAARTLGRGLALARRQDPHGPLARELAEQLRCAERAHLAERVHAMADHARLVLSLDAVPETQMQHWKGLGEQFWAARQQLLDRAGASLSPDAEDRLRADCVDLTVLRAEVQGRLSYPERDQRRHELAHTILTEMDGLLGGMALLRRELARHETALGRPVAGGAPLPEPATPWELAAEARSLCLAENYQGAHDRLEQALHHFPQNFWLNYYQGMACHRLRRLEEAFRYFQVCVALAPERAECWFNRGLTAAGLGQTPAALRDYDRALLLNPSLADAYLNRGLLRHEAGRHADALADLHQALHKGADPARVHYNRALVHLARNERGQAEAALEASLRARPEQPSCRDLLARLRSKRPAPLTSKD